MGGKKCYIVLNVFNFLEWLIGFLNKIFKEYIVICELRLVGGRFSGKNIVYFFERLYLRIRKKISIDCNVKCW